MQSYLKSILTARVYDVAIERPLELAPNCRRARQHGCCSSAKTCSRCSRSSCAALTTRWRNSAGPVQTRRDRRLGRQPRTRRGALGQEDGLQSHHRHAHNHAANQGACGAPAASARRESCCTATPMTTPTLMRWNWRRKNKLTFVHPYDDPDVIAGQGTIGMEILRQQPGTHPRHLLRHRRRRIDLRRGGLCQTGAPRHQSHRREATDADAMFRSLKAGSASGSTMSACSPTAPP